MTRAGTRRKVHALLRIAYRLELQIHVWASTPCTDGCPWPYINDSLGIITGNPELSDALIKASIVLCRHCHRLGGSFSWEWPDRNRNWKRDDVLDLIARCGAVSRPVASSAVGFAAKTDEEGQKMYLRKRWRIETTHPALAAGLAAYESAPSSIPADKFVQCRGATAAKSAFYPDEFARMIWKFLVAPSAAKLH